MNELQEEVVITRLMERIESGNTFILKQIGKTIKEIGELTPTQARKLQQMIKYGSSYQTIIERLAKITNKNVSELDEIFNLYAKKDYQFAEKFYRYKGITYVPFNEFKALQTQIQAFSNMTKGTYMNLVKTSVLGFTLKDTLGNARFYNIAEAYQYAVDQALLSISQGKDTFNNQMYSLLKQFGNSGIRTIDYASGRSRRLDSAMFMNLKDALKELHNETQQIIGESFGADGVEISVHENPADDHEDIQGRQFSNEEFDKLQNGETAIDYKGISHEPIHNGKERRPIGELNCYHKIFAILLGVSEPRCTNEQLEEIKERNEKGFDFEGKHFTMYEGTQLQRRIETEIRKQKDNQILGREADNKLLISDAQFKITQLTNRYKELSKVSGLKTKMDRLRVSGYKRVKV